MRCLTWLACLFVLMPTLVQGQAGDGRIYVRRIEFLGVDGINDDVLRRELRQFEGTHINTVELEQSRLRLERLPYIQSAEFAVKPLTDSPDQVDILITIIEAPAREYRAGGGYSESLRFSGFAYFVNENLFGSGQRIFARLDASEFRTAAELAHTNPYARSDGISRTVGIKWQDIDQLTVDTTELEADTLSARLEYSYRIAERQAIRFGLALQDAELTTASLTSTQLESWVSSNGNPSQQESLSSTEYLSADFLLGWHHDTRDRKSFPLRGLEQMLNLTISIPGSEVEYYTIDYALSKYWALKSGWTANLNTKLGYGSKFGSNTTSLAPYLNKFAGGPDSVRGYRENRLGPKDSLGNPYGGNLFVATQIELLMPLPEKWQRTTRIGFFYDVGNVYSTEGVTFLDNNGQSLDYRFDFPELRQSAGIAAQFRLPFGRLRLSYGIPLNADDDNPNRFLRDDIQRFQIAFGVN